VIAASSAVLQASAPELQIERLSRNLDAADIAAARQAAHALKGAAANLGAVHLSALCRHCEGVGSTEMTKTLPDIITAFDAFCSTVFDHSALAA
jgi:HPt (histidine-containing phosphotransfer) domain-containing protein